MISLVSCHKGTKDQAGKRGKMASLIIGSLHSRIAVEVPENLHASIAPFLRAVTTERTDKITKYLHIYQQYDRLYQVHSTQILPNSMFASDILLVSDLTAGNVLDYLLQCIARDCAKLESHLIIAADLVGWSGHSIAIIGNRPDDSKRLAAWFIEQGFSYLSGDHLAICDTHILPFPTPLLLPDVALSAIGELESFKFAPSIRTANGCFIEPQNQWLTTGEHKLNLILFAHFKDDIAVSITACRITEAADRITSALINPDYPEATSQIATRIADIPTYSITFSDYAALHNVVDLMAKVIIGHQLNRTQAERFTNSLQGGANKPVTQYLIPEISDRKFTPKLTIGMATYNDYDGVYFSLQAIRLYHPEVMDDVEFVVIDNNPHGIEAASLKKLEGENPRLRYIPQPTVTGTAVRDFVFQQAAGKYVLCMDCHVMFAAGALKKLIDYFDARPDSRDLIQGPMLHNDFASISSHWEEKWDEGMWGAWTNNPLANDPDAEPFDIPMQGLGVFACVKAAWPGLNPAFRGFGGEEGYLHEKFRQRGGRTLCVPFLRWLHRFERPGGVPYKIKWEDILRNYLHGYEELGLSQHAFVEHFSQYLGARTVETACREYRHEIQALSRTETAGSGENIGSGPINDRCYASEGT